MFLNTSYISKSLVPTASSYVLEKTLKATRYPKARETKGQIKWAILSRSHTMGKDDCLGSYCANLASWKQEASEK